MRSSKSTRFMLTRRCKSRRRASAVVGLAGALAATLWIPSAAAADLDPGYADVPPPLPQQNVTFGSGWYVRGDIGVTKDYGLDVARLPNSTPAYGGASLVQTNNAGYDLSLGGGYAFTNNVRGDVLADFHQPVTTDHVSTYCYNSSSAACTASGRFDSYDAMVNGYYDFTNFGIVTPYLGAGAGVGFGRIQTKLYGLRNIYSDNSTYHSFAWALMAGIAVDVYAHTKLDVGYRYLDNGTVLGSRLYRHEIRAGLRYMIDN